MTSNKSINWVIVLFLLVATIGATTFNFDTGFYPGNVSTVTVTTQVSQIYQEDSNEYNLNSTPADGTNFVPTWALFLVNYTKPSPTSPPIFDEEIDRWVHVNSSSGAIWKVKTGGASLDPFNVTIPSTCWNYHPTKIILAINSSSTWNISGEFANFTYSQPLCLGADGWEAIGTTRSCVSTTGCTLTSGHSLTTQGFLYSHDGNWEKGSFMMQFGNYPYPHDGVWYGRDTTNNKMGNSYIYEEAIYWIVAPTDPIYLDVPSYFQNITVEATMTITGGFQSYYSVPALDWTQLDNLPILVNDSQDFSSSHGVFSLTSTSTSWNGLIGSCNIDPCVLTSFTKDSDSQADGWRIVYPHDGAYPGSVLYSGTFSGVHAIMPGGGVQLIQDELYLIDVCGTSGDPCDPTVKASTGGLVNRKYKSWTSPYVNNNFTWVNGSKEGVTWEELYNIVTINFTNNLSAILINTTGFLVDGRTNFGHTVFDNKMWVIGGKNNSGDYLNDSWTSTNGSNWTRTTEFNGFPAGENFVVTVFGDSMYMAGGSNCGSCGSSVWKSSTNGSVWTLLNDSAFENNQNYTQPAFLTFNNGSGEELWLIDTDNRKTYTSTNGISWTKECDITDFTNRSGTGSFGFQNKMWITGGWNPEGYFNDVYSSTNGCDWTLNLKDYQTLLPSVWSARYNHQIVLLDDKVYLLGGRESGAYTDEVYSSSDAITFHEDTNDPGWSARASFGAWVLNGKMFIAGGVDSEYVADNESWKSNTEPATNPYITIGNTTIWSYNGSFETSELTADFGEAIKLNISSPVYLNLYSDTAGTIQLSNLTINYTPTNNITLNFFDSTTGLLMNGKNVTLEFIGIAKFNGSTSTGVYTTNSILSDTYTIAYNSDGYEQNTYIVDINYNSNYNLTLYMVNDTAEIVEITVEDRFGNPLDGAVIKIQKYLNNEWILEQIVETDQLGRTLGYYIPNTQYYNHIIEYNGFTVLGEINSDSDKMIILDSDVLNGITFRVNVLGTGVADLWYNTFGVDHQLTYVNTTNTTGFFRFLWNDPGGNTQTGCITVEFGASMTNVCSCTSTLSTTATGDVTCTINQSTTQRDSYKAVGLLKQSDTNAGITLYVPVETLWKMIGTDTRINWGTTGLIIGFLVVLITIFAFIRSPAMAIYMGTGAFVGLALLGLTFRDISFGALMVIVVIGYLIASLKSDGGLNA